MSIFVQHSESTAPTGAAEVLAKVRQRYGFVPNLAAFLAESPIALDAIMGLSAAFDRTSLAPQERQIVLLTASARHNCHYCRTVHTGLGRQAGVDDSIIQAVVGAGPIEDPKFEALRALTAALIEQRGRVDEAQITNFLGAGYSKAQVFEVVMGVALKTFTNYCNHLAGAQPNAEFVAMSIGK